MTPSISCLYMSYNRDPANFTFIKYENFVKVIFNRRSVILSIKQFIENFELFQLYVISLLFTEDTSTIYEDVINDSVYYGIYTMTCSNFKLANSYRIIYLEKSPHRNPLKSKEPKRASSRKKYNKFMKYFLNCYSDESYIIHPLQLLYDYYACEAEEVVGYFNEYLESEMHDMMCELEEDMIDVV